MKYEVFINVAFQQPYLEGQSRTDIAVLQDRTGIVRYNFGLGTETVRGGNIQTQIAGDALLFRANVSCRLHSEFHHDLLAQL